MAIQITRPVGVAAPNHASSSFSSFLSLSQRRVRRLVVSASLLAVLGSSGCAKMSNWRQNGFKVGPNYCPPASQTTNNWIDFKDPAIKADSVDDRTWWKVFNDPALDELIQSTYQGNLQVRGQAQKIMEYRALQGIAVGNLFPQTQNIDGFAKRAQISSAGNISGVPLPTRSFNLMNIGPNLQWELDIWGKYRRQIEQADAALEQEVELYDDILSISVADTAKAYANFRAAQEYVRLARENVKVQQGSLKLAETRFKAGATSELDVTQAQSSLSATEAMIPQFQIDLRKANNELCFLMGVPTRDLTQEFKEAPIPVAPTSVAMGIPGELMRRRPDVRAAERDVAKTSAEIGVAESDLYPHFSIDGSFGWTASQASNWFTGPASGGIVGPSFRWDILNYGRIANNVRRHEARFQKSATKYQQTVLNANKEIENAIVSFLKSQERAASLKSAAEATQKSVNLALIQYREGAIDFDRIYNLQNMLVRQQIELAQARTEISLALIDIYRALRGGWQIRQDMPLDSTGCIIKGVQSSEKLPIELKISEKPHIEPKPSEKLPVEPKTPGT